MAMTRNVLFHSYGTYSMCNFFKNLVSADPITRKNLCFRNVVLELIYFYTFVILRRLPFNNLTHRVRHTIKSPPHCRPLVRSRFHSFR